MSPRARSPEAGFSLVEMLAALAVLAIAGLALMNAVTQSGRAAGLARESALARTAAENLMNQAVLDATAQRGIAEEEGVYELAGRVYAWRIETFETTDPQLRRVVLGVWDEEAEQLLAERITFRRMDGS